MTTLLASSSTSVPGWVWALVGVAIGVVVWAMAADMSERNDPDR
jgi:hypothetical protein